MPSPDEGPDTPTPDPGDVPALHNNDYTAEGVPLWEEIPPELLPPKPDEFAPSFLVGQDFRSWGQPTGDNAIPNRERDLNRIRAGLAGAQSRQYFDPTNTDQSRGFQNAALLGLQNQMNDKSGGIAGAQFQQASDQNQMAALAAMAGGQGPGGVGGQGNVTGQFGNAASQMAGQGGSMRLQEQIANQGEYQKQLGNTQAQNLAGQQLEMQQAQMRNAMTKYYLTKGMSAEQAAMKVDRDQKMMDMSQNMFFAKTAMSQLQHDKNIDQTKRNMFLAGAGGAAGGIASLASSGNGGGGGGNGEGYNSNSNQGGYQPPASQPNEWANPYAYGGTGYGD